MSAARTLPPAFADLEVFARTWAVPTIDERLDVRFRSNMAEIQQFYDVVIERAGDMLVYLEQYPLDCMPPEAERLMQLLLGLAQASIGVEVQGQPLPKNATYPIAIRMVAGVEPFG